MLEMQGPASTQPRAFLRVAGLSVARHQLAIALASGCQRIICIAKDFYPELIPLQHHAELHGASFAVISSGHALLGMVTPEDDVLALSDGFLAQPTDVAPLLTSYALLAQSVEEGLKCGFERIDNLHASAGAMRFSGDVIPGLSPLPSDCDTHSALMRLALQSGTQIQVVPREITHSQCWKIINNEAEAQAVEEDWFRTHLEANKPRSLGHWLAGKIVQAGGPALLHGGSGSSTVLWGALSSLFLSLGAGFFDFYALSFALCGFSWLLLSSANLLGRLELNGKKSFARLQAWTGFSAVLVDITICILATWATLHNARLSAGGQPSDENSWLAIDQALVGSAFAPFLVICLLHILPNDPKLPKGNVWMDSLDDRFALSMSLAVLAVGGGVMFGLQALGITLGGIGLYRTFSKKFGMKTLGKG